MSLWTDLDGKERYVVSSHVDTQLVAVFRSEEEWKKMLQSTRTKLWSSSFRRESQNGSKTKDVLNT
jgi:hypothetical protein